MSSTFFGLSIATSGLLAQQTAMNVLGHNISNANNPTYKRQQAVMGARSAQPYPSGAADPAVGRLGAGTSVATIRRMQDGFIDGQLRASSQSLGQWGASQQALSQVVGIIGEPSDYGLGNDLDKFWNSWQDLSLNAENTGVRNNIIAFGTAAAGTLNRIYTQIDGIRSFQDVSIKANVDTINTLGKELASVNDEIQRTLGAGDAPNDLLDRRDAILGDLSKLVDVQVYGNGGTSDVITIGGRAFVQGNRSTELTTGTDAEGHVTVLWSDDNSQASIGGGELGGQLTVQNTLIPGYLEDLDKLANTLMSRVNELHSGGVGLDGSTGLAFFEGSGARDIHVNAAVADNPQRVAASASGAPGDASVALAIAKVKSERLLNGATIGEGYRSFVSRTAADAATAEHQFNAQELVFQQVTLQQQSVSGVSLDEEMADLVRFQQAYNASARVVTVMDEMLSTLVDRLGVVGR